MIFNDIESILSRNLSEDEAQNLYSDARSEAQSRFGTGIFVRGLVEVTNVCRNDCLYCGIRRSNKLADRYTLSLDETVQACQAAYRAGLRTFVMQGGENPAYADCVEEVVATVHELMPDAAITLSLGEHPTHLYRRWRQAGASRYLLRHEAADPALYSSLHPSGMSLEHRMDCLQALRDEGFQVGTGMMVGVPGQTVQHIMRDIEFMDRFRPEMIGIGPYIPHAQTPLANCAPGSIDMTLKLISILRLMFPNALIPSTTALATLHPRGRLMGILAGANVVMPNVSPVYSRTRYSLYDGKAHSDAEAIEGLAQLQSQLDLIGYQINFDKGDFKKDV